MGKYRKKSNQNFIVIFFCSDILADTYFVFTEISQYYLFNKSVI